MGPGEAGLGQPGDSSGLIQSWAIRKHAADATGGGVSLFFLLFLNIITGLLLKLPVTKFKFFFSF